MKRFVLLSLLCSLLAFSLPSYAQPVTCQIVITDNTIVTYHQGIGDSIQLYQQSVVRTHYLSGYCHWNIKYRFIRQVDTYLGGGQYQYGTPQTINGATDLVDSATYMMDVPYIGYQGTWSGLWNSKTLHDDITSSQHGHGHYELMATGYCLCSPRGWVSPMAENVWRQYGDSCDFYGANFPH